MKKFKLVLLIIITVFSCTSDDENSADSNGSMEAVINGIQITFNPDKAKEFPGTAGYLSIIGKNCSERILLRFDIPIDQTGSFSLEELGFVSYLINSASACPGETGGNTTLTNIEASVTVTALTATRVEGEFSFIVYDGLADTSIENGVFDIAIEF